MAQGKFNSCHRRLFTIFLSLRFSCLSSFGVIFYVFTLSLYSLLRFHLNACYGNGSKVATVFGILQLLPPNIIIFILLQLFPSNFIRAQEILFSDDIGFNSGHMEFTRLDFRRKEVPIKLCLSLAYTSYHKISHKFEVRKHAQESVERGEVCDQCIYMIIGCAAKLE